MNRMIKLILISFLFCFPSAVYADESEGTITWLNGYKSSSEITLVDPVENDKQTRDSLEHLKDFGIKIKIKNNCKLGKLTNLSCLALDSGQDFLSPYPLILPRKLPKLKNKEHYTNWMDLKVAKNGEKIFDQWHKLAESRKLFDCKGNICSQLIKVLPENIDLKEAYIFSCLVYKSEDTLSPPQQCEQIAIITESATSVLGVTGNGTGLPSRGEPDYSIQIFTEKGKLPTNTEILQSIEKQMLEGDLSLQSEVYNGSKLVGTAKGRSSLVLDGWREWIVITVDVNQVKEKKFVGLTVTSTLYVNKQATADNKDWTMANDLQEDKYKEVIKDEISTSLNRLCNEIYTKTSAVHICNR